ncbi:MAG TPA: T9SS type A sorting domain-containing protein [Bacteroidales bacterium]|nr:T9SS type A sorting domain-containing protein [Bacteroidales bacterium]HPS27973.1 T9SS type A sorting domain-containing protein [Bacteroidales bacterium]
MKSKFYKLAFGLFLFLLFPFLTMAQTAGTLTFTVTTAAPSGQYSPKHLVAMWIQNSSVTNTPTDFIKTKIAYTRLTNPNYSAYLNKWVSASARNVVDATTGATRNISSETLTFTWNATNVSGTVVPDGTYYVWMQMTASNTNGTAIYVEFTKGPAEVTLTPANSGNYSGMSLHWMPSNSSVSETETNKLFSVSPNPVNASSKLSYSLSELADVTITMYDVSGKLIEVILDKNQPAGNYSLALPVLNRLKSGVYFVSMYTGKARQIVKIIVS